MNDKFFELSIFALVVAVVAFLGFMTVKSATSSGKIDYCYVESIRGATGGYEVIGHRPWKVENAHLGAAGSPEAANELIKNSVSCPK